MSFSSFGSMIYYILCTITYINSYPIHVSCLLSCCGYTPMLYFSFNFLFSLLSVLYLFISFSYTILCTFSILYSCNVHVLFSYTYIHVLFISYTVFLLYFSYGFLFYVLAYVVIYFHMIFIYYAFHMLFVYYAFHILYLFIYFSCTIFFSYTVILYFTFCSCNCLYFHRIAVLCFSYHVISYTLHLRFHSDYRIGIHDRFDRESRHVCHSVAM